MPPIVIDLGIAVLILGMTYALMSEGAWGAALMFFNAVFAGLITFNFYEPMAAVIASNVGFLSGFADTMSMLLIFGVTLLLMRLATESIAPAMVRLPTPIYHLGRVAFGFAGSCVVMAIVILAFETAPVHRKIFGVVDYDYRPPFKMGLDRYWLAFVQYSTGYTFPSYGSERTDREFGNAKVFDPEGKWLLVHQDARPYGKGSVLEEATAEDATAEGGQGGGGEAPSGPSGPAMEGGPGGPGGPPSGRGDQGANIPGGTAGAAAGLAPGGGVSP